MKRIKRITSLFLCVIMCVTVLPLPGFAAYENTHTNTGNQIADLIAVANTQIGYTEGNSTSQMGGTSGGSGNYTKYGSWYGINPGAWCAMFVSWCANQAGISGSIIPKHASCDVGMQWFKNNGLWKWSKCLGGSYTPKAGDIIYFRTNTSITYDSTHVGIVYASDSSYVYTIEGNASNRCQKKSYSLSSAYILGYGVPQYTSGSTGYSTGTYKVTASSLNMRSSASTSGTVYTSLPTGATVVVTSVSGNWGYCTYGAYSGWIHLGYCVLVSTDTSTTATYTITFDANGGTLTGGSSTYQIAAGQVYSSVIGDMPKATRNGYTFGGWYCEAYGYTLNMSDKYAVEENNTFIALWNPQYGVYSVTAYALNMRSGPGSSYEVVTTLSNGDQVTVTAINDKWGYCAFNGHIGWISLNYCTYVGEAFNGYILTLDPDGGNMPEGYGTTYIFQADEKFVDIIGGYPIPTKEGFDFVGWQRSDWSSDFWIDGWGTQPYTFGYNITAIARWQTHSCSYTGVVTAEATCTAEGVKTYSCSCGESYTESISKLDHVYTTYSPNGDATCVSDGTKTAYCDYGCGTTDTATDTGSATGIHAWGEWKVTVPATTTTVGEECRSCGLCGGTETREIPMLKEEETGKPMLSTDNYTVYITEGDSIRYVRYASGEYTTGSAIKNAKDCVTLNASIIAGNVTDGVFSYEVANGGIYSFWIKTEDGSEYIYTGIDMTYMTQYVSTYGVNITVHNLYGVRDFFIAKGEHATYSEIKANGYVVQVTSVKINGAHDYTYTVTDEGVYTVLVRYNDSTRENWATSFEIDCLNPTFSGNGLQLTIGNLKDVKVIRTAYGEYNSVSSIKNAPGTRSFTQSVIKGEDSYTIQYREEGTVSVIVQYNNGYYEVYKYELVQKVPSFSQDENTITFGDLEDLYIIRYALGEYTTPTQIKHAAGSKYIKSDMIDENGNIVITLTKAGTYTFFVQYDDESCNYYTVVVK